jgi:hypothetical protein
MQQLFEQMTSLDGWSFYSPDSCVVGGGDDCQVCGAVYSSSDMNVFDIVLNQLRAIKHEKANKCKNDLPFTSRVILDMGDWSKGYLNNSMAQKKKVQSVLVNQKQKVSSFMKKKWEHEKSERMAKIVKHLEEYEERLITDKDFAKLEEKKRQAEKERVNRKKIDQSNMKQRKEDMNILFENFFEENRIWRPIADLYQKKYYTAYMPIGNEKFLYEHAIVRKEDLYKTISSNLTVNSKTGDIQVSVMDPLQGCSIVFAEGKVLPEKSDNFDMWYRSLPIHKVFLNGKESEIHYLAPDKKQPDFPFVYVNWYVDCELSEEEDNKEDF